MVTINKNPVNSLEINQKFEVTDEVIDFHLIKTLDGITVKDDDDEISCSLSTKKRKAQEMEKDNTLVTAGEESSKRAKHALTSKEANISSSTVAAEPHVPEVQQNLETDKWKLTEIEANDLIDAVNNADNISAVDAVSDKKFNFFAFNKIIYIECEKLPVESKTGISVIWHDEEKLIRFFCFHKSSCAAEKPLKLSNIKKIFVQKPGVKHLISDPSTQPIDIEGYSYDKVAQLNNIIQEIYDPSEKTFQKAGKKTKFVTGDYFVTKVTNAQIRVFPCKLHDIVSLNNIQTLLETKAIAFGLLDPHPTVLATNTSSSLSFDGRKKTRDGFYFATEVNSINLTIKTKEKYLKLCRLISPEHYKLVGVNIVNYKTKTTYYELQAALTHLGKFYVEYTGEKSLTNHQLRKYLNTIHNYFLTVREYYFLSNLRDSLIEAYDLLMHDVLAADSFNSGNYDLEKYPVFSI